MMGEEEQVSKRICTNAKDACNVHVVRHGQVDNPRQVFYGRMPGFGLHPNGFAQASSAGKYLKDIVKDISSTVVVASPMQRAHETAGTIAKCLKETIVVQIDEGVNEVHGPHDGKPIVEMIANDWAIYNSGPDYESFEDVCNRVKSTLVKLVKEFPNAGDIIVVSHGDCVCASRLWGFGREFTLEERSMLQETGYPQYCSITSLQITMEGTCNSIHTHDPCEVVDDGKKA